MSGAHRAPSDRVNIDFFTPCKLIFKVYFRSYYFYIYIRACSFMKMNKIRIYIHLVKFIILTRHISNFEP